MDGVLTCARYAFAPNYYKYCGPDANRNLAGYLKTGASDPGLSSYLSEFAVLFPYLKLIAHENGLADPFDSRVVEAYWVGNALLEKVGLKAFADHLHYGQRLKMRLPPRKLKWIIEKVPKGAKMHHSFHVFSIYTRTGNHAVDHTLETMDSCRISWGKVLSNGRWLTANGKVRLQSQRLVYEKRKLRMKDGVLREVSLPMDGNFSESLRPGDWLTFHWGFVCDRITQEKARLLSTYTKHHLRLANQTL